jgi:hypothetical protein
MSEFPPFYLSFLNDPDEASDEVAVGEEDTLVCQSPVLARRRGILGGIPWLV